MENELKNKSNTVTDDLKGTLNHLQTENQLMQRFLEIAEPDLLVNFAQEFEELTRNVTPRERLKSIVSSVMNRGLRSSLTLGRIRTLKNYSFERTLSLSTQHTSLTGESNQMSATTKHIIAGKVCAEISDVIKTLEVKNDQQHRILRAEIEERKSCIKEIGLMRTMFEEIVIRDGTNPITGEICSKTFFSFLNSKLKKLDHQIVMFRFSSNVLLRKLRSLHDEMPFLEEMRRQLHDIDLDVHKISYEQAFKQFEEQEIQIPKRKRLLIKFKNELQTQADGLASIAQELFNIENNLSSSLHQMKRFRSEIKTMEQQENDAQYENEKLKQMVNGYKAPDVLSYIKISEELSELQKQLAMWRKKKSAQDITLLGIKKEMNAKIKFLPDHLRLKCRQMLQGREDIRANVNEPALQS